MKQKHPISKASRYPKRGAEFKDEETKQVVYLYRVKSEILYLVSTDPQFKLASDMYEVSPSRLKASRPVVTSTIKAKPKRLTSEQIKHQEDMNAFFESQSKQWPECCCNCNQKLNAPGYDDDKRFVIAHILPKKESQFPELATDPDNVFALGVWCGCHNRWDFSNAETRSKMPCYKIALERFENLKAKLSQPQLIKAYTYLNISWQ